MAAGRLMPDFLLIKMFDFSSMFIPAFAGPGRMGKMAGGYNFYLKNIF